VEEFLACVRLRVRRSLLHVLQVSFTGLFYVSFDRCMYIALFSSLLFVYFHTCMYADSFPYPIRRRL